MKNSQQQTSVAVDEMAVPIREISRLTGVNTVTLRAWERRYGLLKPTRTSKGHRLYSRNDIQRVKDIQSWLVRGLAIGKVRAVLANEYPEAASQFFDDVWCDYASQLTAALQNLDRKTLEILFGELFSIYPLEVVADKLLAPTMELLQQNRYANATRREFLSGLLYEYFYAGNYRQHLAKPGQSVLLIKLNLDESDVLPLMLNCSLLIKGYEAEYCGTIPPEEWVFAAEQFKPQLIILYSDSAGHLVEVTQQIEHWAQVSPVPLFLSGKITTLFTLDGLPSESIEGCRFLGDGLQNTLLQLSHYFPTRH